jgi:hypothetical protein
VRDSFSAATLIRQAAAAGDAACRVRRARRRVAILAPWVAGVALLISIATLVAGGSPWLGPALLVAAAAIGAGVLLAARWSRSMDDAAVRRLDDDADLQGALRSAHWFVTHASASASDPGGWLAFHLDRTAALAGDIPWRRVYSSRRSAAGARVAGVLSTAVLLLPFWPPSGSRQTRPAATVLPFAAAEGSTASVASTEISPVLLPRIVRAFNAMKAGAVPSKQDLSAVEQALRAARANPTMQQDLDRLFNRTGGDLQQVDPGDSHGIANQALKQKIERELETGESQLQWAFEDAVSRASATGQPQERAESKTGSTSDADGHGTSQAAEPPSGTSRTVTAAADDQDGSGANGGSPLLMGAGGLQSNAHADTAASQAAKQRTAALIEQALRREVVDASADLAGRSVQTSAGRRTTTDGEPSLATAAAAGRAGYDSVHATSPPVIPASRQALVRGYFARTGRADAQAATAPDGRADAALKRVADPPVSPPVAREKQP